MARYLIRDCTYLNGVYIHADFYNPALVEVPDDPDNPPAESEVPNETYIVVAGEDFEPPAPDSPDNDEPWEDVTPISEEDPEDSHEDGGI